MKRSGFVDVSLGLRNKKLFNKNTISAVLLSFIVSACGGGSGSSGSPSPTPPPTPTPTPTPTPPPADAATSVSIEGDAEVMVNQSIGLVAILDGASSEFDFSWTQTSGAAVSMLSSNSQVLSFDIPESGTYSFSVSVSDSSGAVRFQDDFSVTASEAQALATVRLDHAVSEEGKVSVRADALPGSSITSINWQQVSGPTVPDNNFPETTSSPNFLFFDAPAVTSDQLLQFRATMTLESGENVSDDVYVLVKDVAQSSDGYFPDSLGRVVTAEMMPYQSDSPYANALESCVYNNVMNSTCSFSTLPLLGQVVTNPTVEDVMDRVYVSHKWMGDRLKDYLENSVAAEDMLALFRGVTAIVISYEVRPSFYWVATGAIYLDAANFWVTPQERDTLNDVPDFRSSFGQDLQFLMPWRYVRNNRSYLNRASYPRNQRGSRSFEDVEADITWLMYHELAHANDFFPPDRWSAIPSSSDPLAYFRLMPPDSTSFSALFPLNSQELTSLAQVSFGGEDATTIQRNYTDIDAANFFEPDNAAMYYSFLNEREDYATLFERFMMAYRFDAEADTAVMLLGPENPELLVTWGQRSRISDPKLTARTRHVVRNILPALDVDTIQPTLPEAKLLRPGVSWSDNLILDSDLAGRSAQSRHKLELTPETMPSYMKHYFNKGKLKIPEK